MGWVSFLPWLVRMRTLLPLTLLLLSSVGCVGELMMPEPTVVEPDAGPALSSAALNEPEAFGVSLLQRLTQRQLVGGAEVLFGVSAGVSADLAPLDSPSATYFDNDADGLGFSLQLITDYETFAWSYARLVKQDRVAFVTRAGCSPSGPSDEACFRKYVAAMGRRVFHRALTQAEVDTVAQAFMPFAAADQDFFSAVELSVAMWLQHPEFLYRIEAGEPSSGRPVALSQHEVAARLSFLVTGLPPDDALLDAADRGLLASPAGRATQAERLLATPAAVAHAQHLHSRWLGFADRFLLPSISVDALAETNALVEQLVVDPQRDWMSLFTTEQTWVTPALAAHYGVPSPGATAGWVKPDAARGGGVLSHATYAALGAKFGDTSPTLRGYETFKRLTCGRLFGDIPDGVDTSMPPGGGPSACKPERYTMRTTAGCEHCHSIMDPIGLGLEQLGPNAEWRASEPNRAACGITGEGSLFGKPFTGPAQLAQVLANEPKVQRCLGEQLFESMAGRNTTVKDDATLLALRAQYVETRSYDSLVVALARAPGLTMKTAR